MNEQELPQTERTAATEAQPVSQAPEAPSNDAPASAVTAAAVAAPAEETPAGDTSEETATAGDTSHEAASAPADMPVPKREKKKRAAREPRRPMWIFTVAETLAIFFCIFCKMYYVYRDLFAVGAYIPLFMLATMLLVAVICLLWRLVFRRTHLVPLLVLYVFLSVAAFIDSVYCAYVGQLPSVASLQFTGQLAAVSTTIRTLITFKRLCFILDLPVWLLWGAVLRPVCGIFVRRYRAAHPPRVGTRTLRRALTAGVGGICMVLSAAFGVLFARADGFQLSYLKNELFTYHVRDVYQVMLSLTGLSETTFDELAGARPVTQNQLNFDDPLCGSANGMNVIYIQVEAMQNFVIGLTYNGQEVTPNINRFLEENTLNFNHHYYQIGGGNTSDAEFVTLNSLYGPFPDTAYTAYTENDYYSTAHLLKDNGYSGAYAFHAGDPEFWNREAAYPYQGFDDFIAGADEYPPSSLIINLGPSDVDMFSTAVQYLSAKRQPFFSFIVTLSSHHAYCWIPPAYRFLELLPEDQNTIGGNYLLSIRYYDYAFGLFLDELKASGLYDNTAIVMYGDHFGLAYYTQEQRDFVSRVLGRPYTYADHFNTPLLFHVPGIESKTYDIAAGNVDIMPTMLYLLGLKNEKGYMFGQNLLQAEHGCVYEYAHLGVGSFISDDVFFMMPFTGIFENAKAYDISTFEELNPTPYRAMSDDAKKTYEYGMYLLNRNAVLTAQSNAASAGDGTTADSGS